MTIAGKTPTLLLQAKNYSGTGDWLDESGNSHDAQLGSTAGADANDPEALPFDGDKYVLLPKVAGNALSTPHASALAITGDLDLRVRVLQGDIVGNQALLAKQHTQDNYRFLLTGNRGALYLSTTAAAFASTVAPVTLADDVPIWYRVTLDVDNGASDAVATFYYSLDDTNDPDAVSWTQLGDVVANGSTLTLDTSTNDSVTVGAYLNTMTGDPFSGRIYAAQVRSGIDGTVVFDASLADASEPFATFTERSANAATVTINRSGSGLYVVDRPSFGLHTDDYFEIADHADLDFAAAEDFTAFTVVRPSDATPSADEALLAKKADLSTAAGYAIYLDTTGVPTLIIGDGSASVEATGPALATRTMSVVAVKRDTTADTITVYTDGVAGTPVTDTTTATLANAEALRFGRLSGAGTAYADGEDMADVLFREALTDEEIAAVGEALQSGGSTRGNKYVTAGQLLRTGG